MDPAGSNFGNPVVLQCGYISIPWEYFGWLCDTVDDRPIQALDNLNNAGSESGLVVESENAFDPANCSNRNGRIW